eukprot:5794061-Heterocapsa_arctica.AAC.1
MSVAAHVGVDALVHVAAMSQVGVAVGERAAEDERGDEEQLASQHVPASTGRARPRRSRPGAI